MSKMVARYTENISLQAFEIQAHLLSNGEVHWTLFRSGRNLGQITEDLAKEMIQKNKMQKIFDTAAEEKEFFELMGIILL